MSSKCNVSRSINVAVTFASFVAAIGNVVQWHDTSLLQRAVTIHNGKTGLDGVSCAPLKNEWTSFSVKLCIGTPEQCFEVVADTGSDAVIVPSCVCKEMEGAGCKKNAKCFRGTKNSSTFHVPHPVEVISMGFDSGNVVAAVATDVVRVGDLNVTMKDGVLLILDRSELDISGDFQGILGLGVANAATGVNVEMPAAAKPHELIEQTSSHELNSWRMDCSLEPMLCDDQVPSNRFRGKSWLTRKRVPIPALAQQGRHGEGNAAGGNYKGKLFMEQSQVTRFSMCFNDGEDSGALRLGVPPFKAPLSNVGTNHWGLNFQGLAVGAHGDPAPSEKILCGAETMKPGMESPCGIIPDSGTTTIRVPKEQLVTLETSICSKWERCQNHSKGKPSSAAFRDLLTDCGDWLKTSKHGLLEIPSLFFHVKGGDGSLQAYELTAWAWVTHWSWFYEDGFKKVCSSLFDPMEDDYLTEKHGPIWIVGMPLFFEYDVGYDMSSNQINLARGKCEPCSDGAGPVSLSDHGLRRWPRTMHGKPRIPHYNVDLPL